MRACLLQHHETAKSRAVQGFLRSREGNSQNHSLSRPKGPPCYRRWRVRQPRFRADLSIHEHYYCEEMDLRRMRGVGQPRQRREGRAARKLDELEGRHLLPPLSTGASGPGGAGEGAEGLRARRPGQTAPRGAGRVRGAAPADPRQRRDRESLPGFRRRRRRGPQTAEDPGAELAANRRAIHRAPALWPLVPGSPWPTWRDPQKKLRQNGEIP